jgi:hypothetical protein
MPKGCVLSATLRYKEGTRYTIGSHISGLLSLSIRGGVTLVEFTPAASFEKAIQLCGLAPASGTLLYRPRRTIAANCEYKL